jgi:hypothetical protein
MAEWTANVVRVRTTSDGSGPVVGVVTGTGATPDEALAGLWEAVEGPAREALRPLAEAVERAKQRTRERAKERSWKLPRPAPVVVTDSPLEVAATRKAATPPSVWKAAQNMVEVRQRWDFEVVGVRFVPAQVPGGGPGWLAYGTLVWDLPGTGGTAAGDATRVPGIPG